MLYVNPLEGYQVARADESARQILRRKQSFQEFERVFLYQLLREMRRTESSESIFGTSREQDFFQDMLDDVLAGKMAESGQLGIARQIDLQLRATEQARPATTVRKSDDGLPLQKCGSNGLPLRPIAEFRMPSRRVEGIPLRDTSATGIRLNTSR